MKSNAVILGLGANLGRPLDTFKHLLQRLLLNEKIELIATSTIYQTPALLPENAPQDWDRPYLNMAIQIATTYSPLELLAVLKTLEQDFGRGRDYPKWSPRALDIDILAWGNEHIDLPNLSIPHTGLLDRSFALIPLLEVLPTWQHPLYQGDLWQWVKSLPILSPIPQRLDTPELMAIVNASPESFSGDGGMVGDIAQTLKQLILSGATMIDIGAESTHPNAPKVDLETQWQRLEPWLVSAQVLKHSSELYLTPIISLDSYHPSIVEKALAYGIDVVNDVKGVYLQEMMCLQHSDCRYISMHDRAVSNIDQLEQQALVHLDRLLDHGLQPQQIIYDIGLGFGKNPQQTATLLNELPQLSLPCQLMVGHSRKASVMPSSSHLPAQQRDLESAMVSGRLIDTVDIVRVHNVDATARVWQSIRMAENLSQKY